MPKPNSSGRLSKTTLPTAARIGMWKLAPNARQMPAAGKIANGNISAMDSLCKPWKLTLFLSVAKGSLPLIAANVAMSSPRRWCWFPMPDGLADLVVVARGAGREARVVTVRL